MLKLRLRRIGRKHDPSFRVVVTEATTPPKGKYLESVGFYNARLKQISLDKDRIKHWLSVGVQPTDTVHNLLIKEGIIEGKKIAVHSRKPSKKRASEQAEAEEKTEAAAEAPAEEATAETPAEEATEEAPAKEEVTKEDSTEEASKEEAKEEPKAEEAKEEDVVQEEAKEPSADEQKEEKPEE